MDNSVGNTGFVDDWQANKSVTERNWYMLENSISTDVTFSVSNDALDDDNGMFFFLCFARFENICNSNKRTSTFLHHALDCTTVHVLNRIIKKNNFQTIR